jgi:TPR repeat protein
MRRAGLPYLLVFLALAAWLPQAALADVARGKRAYAKHDYKLALGEFTADAQRSDPEAMFLLGNMYAAGEGVARDDTRAFEWIEKAAQAGYPPAQGTLARFYAGGRGVARDNNKSVEWAHLAADNGDALSQYMMGLRSAEGWGMPKDLEAALIWFGSAAEQGFAPAQFSLGVMTGFGPVAAAGAPRSREYRIEAAKWLALAARQKFPDLKDQPEQRLAELRKNMSGDEIREATERARQWRPVNKNAKP